MGRRTSARWGAGWRSASASRGPRRRTPPTRSPSPSVFCTGRRSPRAWRAPWPRERRRDRLALWHARREEPGAARAGGRRRGLRGPGLAPDLRRPATRGRHGASPRPHRGARGRDRAVRLPPSRGGGAGRAPGALRMRRPSPIETEPLEDEIAVEAPLRPRTLDEYVGQESIRENLRVQIAAARARGDVLDHVLLYGPPGLGKTSLAHVIAHELEAGT